MSSLTRRSKARQHHRHGRQPGHHPPVLLLLLPRLGAASSRVRSMHLQLELRSSLTLRLRLPLLRWHQHRLLLFAAVLPPPRLAGAKPPSPQASPRHRVLSRRGLRVQPLGAASSTGRSFHRLHAATAARSTSCQRQCPPPQLCASSLRREGSHLGCRRHRSRMRSTGVAGRCSRTLACLLGSNHASTRKPSPLTGRRRPQDWRRHHRHHPSRR